jgi:hypothetical protein
MIKPKTSPTHGERFDRILQYLADTEGNDIELVALHEITDALWQLLTPEQEDAFFDRIAPLEAKAARWASHEDGGNVATNAARIAYSFDRGFDLPPAALEEIVAAATALDAIEAQPHFTWEAQAADWESVCTQLADAIGSVHPQRWQRVIRHLRLGLRGVRQGKGAT